jgi:hypothetical protein
MTRTCEACGSQLTRRAGEKPSYFARRKTCGNSCRYRLMSRTQKTNNGTPDGKQRCCKCGKYKPMDAFYRSSRRSSGRMSRCKDCDRVRQRAQSAVRKAWVEANRDKVRATARVSTKSHYHRGGIAVYLKQFNNRTGLNVTVEQYEQLFTAQAGLCAICKRTPESGRLCIDHCHETNKVRGLLCKLCNHGLGCFGDNLAGLRRAVEYLGAVQ